MLAAVRKSFSRKKLKPSISGGRRQEGVRMLSSGGLAQTDCLPHEILAVVFEHAANQDQASRLVVILVCKKWRICATESPRVWDTIVCAFEEGAGGTALRQQARSCMRFSKDAPLHIYITMGSGLDVAKVIEVVEILDILAGRNHASVDRWETFSLRNYQAWNEVSLQYLSLATLEHPTPNLSQIVLSGLDSLAPLFPHVPKLHKVGLFDCSLPNMVGINQCRSLSLGRIFSPINVCFQSNLTALSLRLPVTFREAPPDRSDFPLVTHLRLEPSPGASFDYRPTVPLLRLPALHTVELDAGSPEWSILHSILCSPEQHHLPRWSKLRIHIPAGKLDDGMTKWLVQHMVHSIKSTEGHPWSHLDIVRVIK